MSEDEDLGIFGTVGATAQHEQADHQADKTVEAGHRPDPSDATELPQRLPKYQSDPHMLVTDRQMG